MRNFYGTIENLICLEFPTVLQYHRGKRTVLNIYKNKANFSTFTETMTGTNNGQTTTNNKRAFRRTIYFLALIFAATWCDLWYAAYNSSAS